MLISVLVILKLTKMRNVALATRLKKKKIKFVFISFQVEFFASLRYYYVFINI